MEEQSAATKEIARNVEQALANATTVAGSMQDVQRATEATRSSTTQLNQSSADLETHSGRLSGSVSDFLGALKKVV
jgi:methyl-accepting chemotaxis protein